MACSCDSLKAEVLSQRELMTEWFQTLMNEIRDAKAELVQLIKANTFNAGEHEKSTGQQSSTVEHLSASAFLDNINSLSQFSDAVSESNPVSQSLEPTRNPEMEPTPGPVIRKELISPKIEPAAEEQSVEFSLTQSDYSDEILDEKAKASSALNLLCSVESGNLSAVTVKNEQIKTMSAKKPFACDQCDYRCSTKGNLIGHKRYHTDENPFEFRLCQKRFKQHHGLTFNHMMGHTRANKLFACDQCSFSTYQNSHLKIHQRVHTGVKPFACIDCDFRASRKGSLEIHQRIHTGEKPFACDECDFRTSQKGHLNEHRRIHTGDKLQCELCDYKAVTRSTLIKHRKSKHQPHK